jgi:excisionase family DNA binding protein
MAAAIRKIRGWRNTSRIWTVLSIQYAWHNAAMAHSRKSRECGSTDGALSGGRLDEPPSTEPIDPRAFGFTKAAYAVGEALDLLSIGRTGLYAAVKRGDLKRVKFGKKMLFYAADLVSFLTRLRRSSEENANRVGHIRGPSKRTEPS